MRAALALLLLLAAARAEHRGKGIYRAPGALLSPRVRGLGSVSSGGFRWLPFSPARCQIAGRESERGKGRRGMMFRYPGCPFGVMPEELGGEEAGLGSRAEGGGEDSVAGPGFFPLQGKMRFSDPLHEQHFTVKPTPRVEAMLCATPCCLRSSAGDRPPARKSPRNLLLPRRLMKMRRNATSRHIQQDRRPPFLRGTRIAFYHGFPVFPGATSLAKKKPPHPFFPAEAM